MSRRVKKAEPVIRRTADTSRYEGTLIARNLSKSYGGRRVVNGVSLVVRRGEAVGLLGPNGAGKTTCFYMITGLVPVDEGTIELNGNDVTTMPMYRRARLGVGYLPQEASIFRGLTVEQNIRAVLEVHDRDRARRERKLDSLLAEFSISHLRKSAAIALSGGERRRLEIARALATDPTFMLLDEPFAGVDPISVADIQALVRHLTSRGIDRRTAYGSVGLSLLAFYGAAVLPAAVVVTHPAAQRGAAALANRSVVRVALRFRRGGWVGGAGGIEQLALRPFALAPAHPPRCRQGDFLHRGAAEHVNGVLGGPHLVVLAGLGLGRRVGRRELAIDGEGRHRAAADIDQLQQVARSRFDGAVQR